jgi:hypothetical protein
MKAPMSMLLGGLARDRYASSRVVRGVKN